MTRCGRCDATWTGLSVAHCAAADCHRTFSSPSSFDKHRAGSKDGMFKAGECSDPSMRGLVLNRHGYFGAPGDADREYGAPGVNDELKIPMTSEQADIIMATDDSEGHIEGDALRCALCDEPWPCIGWATLVSQIAAESSSSPSVDAKQAAAGERQEHTEEKA